MKKLLVSLFRILRRGRTAEAERTPAPEGAAAPDDPLGGFKILVLRVLLDSPHPRPKTIEYLQGRWGDADLVDDLLMGELTEHVEWPHIADLFEWCHATPEHTETAHTRYDTARDGGLASVRRRTGPPTGEPAPPVTMKPDPDQARTEAHLLALMRKYRIWAGEPSYDTMAAKADARYAKSTLAKADKGPGLPSFGVFRAYMEGCGLRNGELDTWLDAWRRVRIARPGEGESAH